MNLKEALKNQVKFKSTLSEIEIGGNKLQGQKDTINNISNFCNLWEKVIEFFRDYSFLLSDAKY